jgi:hypothetical protein
MVSSHRRLPHPATSNNVPATLHSTALDGKRLPAASSQALTCAIKTRDSLKAVPYFLQKTEKKQKKRKKVVFLGKSVAKWLEME